MIRSCPRCNGQMFRGSDYTESGRVEFTYCLSCGYEDYGTDWAPDLKTRIGQREPKHGGVRL